MPVTLSGPSTRTRALPINVIAACGSDIAVAFGYSARDLFECMDDTALRQFDLKAVAALRPCPLEANFGGVAECLLAWGLPDQAAFGFVDPPGSRPDAADREMSACDLAVCQRNGNRGGDEREFVGRAVAQFQVSRTLAGRAGRQRHMRHQIAWREHGFDIRPLSRQHIKV